MTTVHKRTLDPHVMEYRLPVGAEILSAGVQGDAIVFWYRCDPHAPLGDPRTILVFGTGHAMPDDPMRFISTVAYLDGLWFHVFEAL